MTSTSLYANRNMTIPRDLQSKDFDRALRRAAMMERKSVQFDQSQVTHPQKKNKARLQHSWMESIDGSRMSVKPKILMKLYADKMQEQRQSQDSTQLRLSIKQSGVCLPSRGSQVLGYEETPVKLPGVNGEYKQTELFQDSVGTTVTNSPVQYNLNDSANYELKSPESSFQRLALNTLSSSMPNDSLTHQLRSRRIQQGPINLKNLLLSHSASISQDGQVISWQKTQKGEMMESYDRLNTVPVGLQVSQNDSTEMGGLTQQQMYHLQQESAIQVKDHFPKEQPSQDTIVELPAYDHRPLSQKNQHYTFSNDQRPLSQGNPIPGPSAHQFATLNQEHPASPVAQNNFSTHASVSVSRYVPRNIHQYDQRLQISQHCAQQVMNSQNVQTPPPMQPLPVQNQYTPAVASLKSTQALSPSQHKINMMRNSQQKTATFTVMRQRMEKRNCNRLKKLKERAQLNSKMPDHEEIVMQLKERESAWDASFVFDSNTATQYVRFQPSPSLPPAPVNHQITRPKESSMNSARQGKNKLQGSLVKPKTAGYQMRTKREHSKEFPDSIGSTGSDYSERSPRPQIKGGTVALQPLIKNMKETGGEQKKPKEELETSGFQNKALVEQMREMRMNNKIFEEVLREGLQEHLKIVTTSLDPTLTPWQPAGNSTQQNSPKSSMPPIKSKETTESSPKQVVTGSFIQQRRPITKRDLQRLCCPCHQHSKQDLQIQGAPKKFTAKKLQQLTVNLNERRDGCDSGVGDDQLIEEIIAQESSQETANAERRTPSEKGVNCKKLIGIPLNIAVTPNAKKRSVNSKYAGRIIHPSQIGSNIHTTAFVSSNHTQQGASPVGCEVSSVAASTDSNELTVKVGKLLDTWIEVKNQVDQENNNGNGSEDKDFIQGAAIVSKMSLNRARNPSSGLSSVTPNHYLKPKILKTNVMTNSGREQFKIIKEPPTSNGQRYIKTTQFSPPRNEKQSPRTQRGVYKMHNTNPDHPTSGMIQVDIKQVQGIPSQMQFAMDSNVNMIQKKLSFFKDDDKLSSELAASRARDLQNCMITEKKKLQPSEKRTEKVWQAQPPIMMNSVALQCEKQTDTSFPDEYPSFHGHAPAYVQTTPTTTHQIKVHDLPMTSKNTNTFANSNLGRSEYTFEKNTPCSQQEDKSIMMNSQQESRLGENDQRQEESLPSSLTGKKATIQQVQRSSERNNYRDQEYFSPTIKSGAFRTAQRMAHEKNQAQEIVHEADKNTQCRKNTQTTPVTDHSPR